ncbi:fumarylacetoacetase [uncultured Caballeronia sp.]|uniref:fumarylacetoacetase n=1 Tax=uncultured Caballeronia sp. TaxID=1827198 RepID=UPI0035CC868D
MSEIDKMDLNATINPRRQSWVASANDPSCDFPIQNLPFGIFSDNSNPLARVGVALGDAIVDLTVLADHGLLPQAREVFACSTLNDFILLGQLQWRDLRIRLSTLFDRDNSTLRDDPKLRDISLIAQSDARLYLPVDIPGYTDFYSSKEHATNVGLMFRDPKNALLPNWLEIPIGYNGRASSVVVSGTPINRPQGQIKRPDSDRPVYASSQKLDIELEVGFIVGSNTTLGEPIQCEHAENHIFGMVLLNDWSARDIQQWEYVPLGPFNSKGFATTISPWIVTLDALEPFRCNQPAQLPEPLSYLHHIGQHGFDIRLEVDLRGAEDSEADTITRTNFRHMYWTMAQQLTHHTSSGCNVRVGDLMGSGTISGPTPDSYGSLLELTWNGQRPLTLVSGEQRTFLEDGDEVGLRGWCQGHGYRVGFGSCLGKIVPAVGRG